MLHHLISVLEVFGAVGGFIVLLILAVAFSEFFVLAGAALAIGGILTGIIGFIVANDPIYGIIIGAIGFMMAIFGVLVDDDY